MASDSAANAPRTNAVQSETADEFRVSFESTDRPMKDELVLRPCWFCGAHPKAGYMGDEDGGYGYVECGGCDDGHFAGVHADDEEAARKIWNTRAALTSSGLSGEVTGDVVRWLRGIVNTDWDEVVADGGVTAGMVVQQEAREQLRRLEALGQRSERQKGGYFECCGRSRLRGHHELCHHYRAQEASNG